MKLKKSKKTKALQSDGYLFSFSSLVPVGLSILELTTTGIERGLSFGVPLLGYGVYQLKKAKKNHQADITKLLNKREVKCLSLLKDNGKIDVLDVVKELQVPAKEAQEMLDYLVKDSLLYPEINEDGVLYYVSANGNLLR